MPHQTDGIVIKNERIHSNYFILKIHCPLIANQIRPGQFIMLKVSEDHYPLLRRPFSIYKASLDGKIDILYKKVGKGTQEMTTFKKGKKISLIGPLGNGFTLPPLPSSAPILLIGGGIGIVSLYLLASALKDEDIFVLVGGKTEKDILCLDDFQKIHTQITVATEDGSLGFKGTVVDLFLSFQKMILKKKPYIFACGPMEMLKELANKSKSKDRFQISLEARMGCGFGACWGCVIKTNHTQSPYQRVCKEGPVFNLKDIDWD